MEQQESTQTLSSEQLIRSCSLVPFRRIPSISTLLSHLLHPDVIPLVLGYESTIQFTPQRSYGRQCGSQDGDLHHPCSLILSGDELFVVDSGNQRMQVFHQGTGRFLRKWGRFGEMAGEFRFPRAAAVGRLPEQQQDHQQLGDAEIFILDDYHVHIFRLCDSHFLRRFPIKANTSLSWSGGLVGHGDYIFVTVSNPSQINIVTKSDGKLVRSIGRPQRWGGSYIGPQLGKLFLEEASSNELWLADSSNHRVLVLDVTSGLFLRQYGGWAKTERECMQNPQAVVVHGEEVIVCDSSKHRLVVFDRSSCQMLRDIGGETNTLTGFSDPYDLAVSCKNQLFVSDTSNDRVLVFE